MNGLFNLNHTHPGIAEQSGLMQGNTLSKLDSGLCQNEARWRDDKKRIARVSPNIASINSKNHIGGIRVQPRNLDDMMNRHSLL